MSLFVLVAECIRQCILPALLQNPLVAAQFAACCEAIDLYGNVKRTLVKTQFYFTPPPVALRISSSM